MLNSLSKGILSYFDYQNCLSTVNKLRNAIKKYNVACGVENTETQGYHETITRFYVCLINQFIQQVDRAQPIDNLAEELISRYGQRSLVGIIIVKSS